MVRGGGGMDSWWWDIRLETERPNLAALSLCRDVQVHAVRQETVALRGEK